MILAPERDDPALGADEQNNDDFQYHEFDPNGLICPHGARVRHANPRDSDLIGDVQLHHIDLQFEFIKSQWLNDGNFAGRHQEKDLLVGDNDGTGIFMIPPATYPSSPARCRAFCHHSRWRVLPPAEPQRAALGALAPEPIRR